MIFINEWLPNPTGDDAKGEFIELFNNAAVPVNLDGWKLKTVDKKFFPLDGKFIAGNGYLLLPRSETKLTLKNSDGALLLYDAAGKLVDQSAFSGAAPDGQSFSRVNYETDPSEHFIFAEPTPGMANNIITNTQVSDNQYPLNKVLNPSEFGVFSLVFSGIFLGVAFAGIMVYALKQDEDLSELFFGKNQGNW